MNRKTVLKLSPIAASLMFALGSPLAHAAAPAAGVLPGAFNSNVSGVTYTSTASTAASINVPLGATVLQWGGTSTTAVPNAVTAPSGITTVAGFNIGSGAALTVSNTGAGTAAVLALDLTGQASNIYGGLTATAAAASNAPTLFVANPNGVVVGASGNIAATNGVALLGYAQDPAVYGGSVAVNSSTITSKGDVTVATGAQVNAGYLLIAGAGTVNVDSSKITAGSALGVAAGVAESMVGGGVTPAVTVNPTAAYFTTAVLNLSGSATNLAAATVGAAGAVNVLAGSAVTLGNANTAIGGTLTNGGTLQLAGLTTTIGGAFVNNATATAPTLLTALGGITNAGLLSGVQTLATGTTAPAAISNSGQITANTPAVGLQVTNAASFTNTGIIDTDGHQIVVTAGAINLGGKVAVGTAGPGSLALTATSGDLTIGADMSRAQVNLSATKGSIFLNGVLTQPAAGSIGATAANQIVVANAITANGAMNLITTKTWTGPYSLGVVIQPTGSLSAGGSLAVTAAANALAYGNISAGGAFQFTGNSFYQGSGASIGVGGAGATFVYDGVITGGIDPVTKTQGTDPFKNAVVVNGGAGGSVITLTAGKLGTANQNTNVMGVGNTTLAASLPASGAIVANQSVVINNAFVPSNLFARAQGGNLVLTGNALTKVANDTFYWPGLTYLSTVKAGMLATVDTSKSITVAGGTYLSNALPFVATGGKGVYMMSGSTIPTNITTNTNSNISVLNPALVGVSGLTAGTPTGSVLTFDQPLPAANLVAFVPPAE